jgi:hypothetical protein
VRDAAVPLDLEVVELLAEEPELLAIADAIGATQPRARPRRRWPRLTALAATIAAVAAVFAALPRGDSESTLLAEALAAVGRGPVVHARIEAELPGTSVVELSTGRNRPQTVAIEYWFDEARGRLRTSVRRGGVLVDEFVQTRAGAPTRHGSVQTQLGAEPALDPALAGFVTGYREALSSGAARRLTEGELEGRRVVWLLLAEGPTRERVAVDAETHAPVLIVPLDADGRAGAISWRVASVGSTARVEADFARPGPQPALPVRGDVRGSRPLSSGQARDTIAWPAVWLGESWRGLRLVSLEQQTLTRGFPPGSGTASTSGAGLRLRYEVGGNGAYVELSQAPYPEPAYAFVGGRATFDGNPIPREGYIELVERRTSSPAVVGQLRRDGVYLTIWASTRELCLEAARALRRMADA